MKCRICGNEQENKTYEIREMMFGYKDVFRYFQCSVCNCLQIREFPPNISEYYPKNYYSFNSVAARNKFKEFLISLRDRYAVYRKGLVGRILYTKFPSEELSCLNVTSVQKNTKILDVGCGTGTLLNSLYNLGIKNILGIDPFIEKSIEYENGLRIQKAELQDVEGAWDIVMFHHAFEHMPNPVETLNIVSKLLSPSGYCIIRIPVVSSYAWRYYGVNWVQLDAPRHYFLHSIESMDILANQAKLKIYKTVYDSTAFQFWGSEQYIKDISLTDQRSYAQGSKNSIFSKKEISNFNKSAKKLNQKKQGDQAVFYLKRL